MSYLINQFQYKNKQIYNPVYPTNSYIYPTEGTLESFISFANDSLDEHYCNRYIPPAYLRLSILLEKILDEVLKTRIENKNYTILHLIQIFEILINSPYGHKFKLLLTCHKKISKFSYGIRLYQFIDSRECLNIIVPFYSNELNERIIQMDKYYYYKINQGIKKNESTEYFYQLLRQNVYFKKATFKEFVNYDDAMAMINTTRVLWKFVLRFVKKK